MSAKNSTTVRIENGPSLSPTSVDAPPVPAALRAGFRALSAVAPPLAAAAAERLFCTPRRHGRPLSEERALCEAEAFTIRCGRRHLAAWRWGRGPAVLLVHGWEGRGSQLSPLVPALVEAGYSAITWDAPAHGESPGRTSNLIEFADAIWCAGRAVGQVHGLVAHSMGAAAAGMALDEGMPVERAVFVAPPHGMATYFDGFADLIGLSPSAYERMVASMERRYRIRLDELSFGAMEGRQDLPLLVVHDEHDREVPVELGRRVARDWPGAELATTSGLGHRRILRDPATIRRAVRFLRAGRERLPERDLRPEPCPRPSPAPEPVCA